jgi:hypothetical protein
MLGKEIKMMWQNEKVIKDMKHRSFSTEWRRSWRMRG